MLLEHGGEPIQHRDLIAFELRVIEAEVNRGVDPERRLDPFDPRAELVLEILERDVERVHARLHPTLERADFPHYAVVACDHLLAEASDLRHEVVLLDAGARPGEQQRAQQRGPEGKGTGSGADHVLLHYATEATHGSWRASGPEHRSRAR